MDQLIEKYALDNALKYKGKANPGAIIGHVIKESPDAKKDMKSLSKSVQDIVSKVNSMSLEEQEARLKEIAPEMLEEKEVEERDIFAFVPEGKNIITAFPPEPSKYPHIGHAKSILINYEYAKRNKGIFILRFEDTNPELAKKEFYDIHLEQYEWLGVKPDEVLCVSDHMEKFYELAEILIKKGLAYVCKEEGELISNSRKTSQPLPDRDKSAEENMKDWKEMFTAKPGSAVLLAKIDLEHKNSVMRDPTLFRILDAEHCRTGKKYRVWPNYDFENSVMDGIFNVTHRFRTKEFEQRAELQKFLQKNLDLPETWTYEMARFNMEGVESSGRIIREKIEKKELIGWDDPSLTTLSALKRRGFQPEAIKGFVLSTGLTKTEATLTWDDLIVHNKRILDDKTDRYSLIIDPVKITIEGAPDQTVELNLHPQFRKGGRKFKTNTEFLISKNDYNSLKNGDMCRLMECLNFKKQGNKFALDSLTYEDFKGKGKIINFLPADYKANEVEILMPDKKIIKGLAEQSNIKIGDIIQFERFGFCKLDEKNKFWFTHK